MKKKQGYISTGIVVSALVFLWMTTPDEASFKKTAAWQRLTNPGALSTAHMYLEDNCSACHSPVTGIDTVKCILCHANNESLLGRQPTSFHASISSCRECHYEHQGRDHRPTKMDHDSLVKIGIRTLDKQASGTDQIALSDQIKQIVNSHTSSQNRTTSTEAVLNCSSCHSNDDRHFNLFGQDCSLCHTTTTWNIPEFRHPSSKSRDCSQCHKAPPSHYMMHFQMISRRVADKKNANVKQCHLCHQTTSWDDIIGVGRYKHH